MASRSNDIQCDELYLIKHLFPNTKWENTNLKNTLPWYMQKSFAVATVLPCNYLSKNLSIFYQNSIRNVHFLETLYHEFIHVQQYQNLDKRFPFGLGFFRCFMMHYLGWSLTLFIRGIFQKKLSMKEASNYAYRANPLEQEAYEKTGKFYSLILIKGIPEDFTAFTQEHPDIVIHKSDYCTSPPLWALIPSIILCFIIFMLKPFLDLFAFCFRKIYSVFKK
jgi:hypothetical protein